MSFEIIILVAVTAFLFLLPLLPGLLEWLRPTDVARLKVLSDYDNNPLYFAEGFRNYINNQIGNVRREQNINGQCADGSEYQLIGEKGLPNIDSLAANGKLLLSAHSITLPADTVFEKEIYSEQTIFAGERSKFRSILAGGRLQLREQCSLLRWGHANGEVAVGKNSRIFGRLTSNHSIILASGVSFERLYAPKIMIASQRPQSPEINSPLSGANDQRLPMLESVKGVRVRYGRRLLMKNNLNFPARHYFDGDIVAPGSITIGEGVHIRGSLKSNAKTDLTDARIDKEGIKHGGLLIGNNSSVEGSIVSAHDIEIGTNCRISGQVIAENLLIIGAGTVIGTIDEQVTVTADNIIVEEGCIIHGSLIARKGGVVGGSASSSLAISEAA